MMAIYRVRTVVNDLHKLFSEKECQALEYIQEPDSISHSIPHWKRVVLSLLVLFITFFSLTQGTAYAAQERSILITAQQFFDERITKSNSTLYLVVRALRFFPMNHIRSLKKLKIEFNNTAIARGLANSRTIIINKLQYLPRSEMISVLVHEMGHVVDLGMLVSKRQSQKTEFKKVFLDDPSLAFYRIAWKSDTTRKVKNIGNFISGYGMSSVYEDFAESYNMYVLHGAEFRNRSRYNPLIAQRYGFLKKYVFGGREFIFSENSRYPKSFFDTTVLSYNFDKFIQAADQSNQIEDEEDRLRRELRRRKGKVRSAKRIGSNRVRITS